MARIKGVDIPNNKRVEISLTYVYGIGRSLSNKILEAAKIEKDKKVAELSEDELNLIREEINKKNNELYAERIAPFVDNYVSDEYEEPSKGSTILTAIVAFILCATIVIVLLAIYAISKMNM